MSNYARLILRRKLNLTRQRHDRDQTENQPRQPWTAVSSYLGTSSRDDDDVDENGT